MPRISVIIPAFNAEHTIRHALDSVFRQTLVPQEIIVVDDGSSDRTLQVASSFPSIACVAQENLGAAAARNLGARHATGEWLAFLDADDVWMPEKLERQHSLTTQADAEVSFHDFSMQRDWDRTETKSWNHKARTPETNQPIETGILRDPDLAITSAPHLFLPSTFFVSRNAFFDSGGYRTEFSRCQDVDLAARLFRNKTIFFVDQPLTKKIEYTRSNEAGVPTHERLTEIFRRQAIQCKWQGDLKASALYVWAAKKHIRASAGIFRRDGKHLRAIGYYGRYLTFFSP